MPNQLCQQLGANIRRLRQRNCLTQETLSEIVFSTQKYISKIETGYAHPSLELCLRIARALHVSLDELLRGGAETENTNGNLQEQKMYDENVYPVIIEKSIWQQVQTQLKQQARPAAGNRARYRYAGLLTCWDCGDGFIPMIRCWNGSKRVEYVCRGYHRNGKSHCSSHRVHEEVLDKAVWNYAEELRERYTAELKKIAQLQKQWALRKPTLDAHCLALQEKLLRSEQELDELVMEKLKK